MPGAIPVINLRGRKPPYPFMVYVGRAREFAGPDRVDLPAHPLANPFVLTGEDTPAKRRDVLVKYRGWMESLPNLSDLLWEVLVDTEGGRLPLACWCGVWDGVTTDNRPLCHAVEISLRVAQVYGLTHDPKTSW